MEVLAAEARRVGAEVALFEIVRRADAAGQETAAEGRVRDGRDAEIATCLQEGDRGVLDVHREGGVFDLHGVDVDDLTGALQRFGAAFAQAEIFDFAAVLKFLHLRDGDFDGLRGLHAVAVVQVDGVDAETFQGFLAGCVDVFGFVADAALAGLGVDEVGEFGGEEDLLALSGVLLEPFAEEVLVVAVHVGGIPVSLAGLEDVVEELETLFVGSGLAVEGREAHEAHS